MRYAVTGGTGFFGSVLMDELASRGHEAIALDLLPPDRTDWPHRSAVIDIRDSKALSSVLKDLGPVDGVFHLAAVLAHDKSHFADVTSTNLDGTRNLMEACRELEIPKVVFTSSNCVFAADCAEPVDENKSPSPIEEYGRSKLQGESLIATYSPAVKSVSLRCPTIISAGRMGLLTILFDFIREGRRLYLVGSGSNKYGFIYAPDLADACIRSMQSGASGIYHVGSDNVPTLRQLYSELAEFAGKKPRFVELPEGPATAALAALYRLGLSPLGPYHYRMLAANFVFDCSKLKAETGWKPTLTNSEMLQQAFTYYVEHREEMSQANVSPHRKPARAGILGLLRLIS